MKERDKKAIRLAFSGAAATYDGEAQVHRHAAQRLAGKLSELPLGPKPTILEVGCGTGLFTAGLAALYADATLLISDLSPAMVERCRRRLGPLRRLWTRSCPRRCCVGSFVLTWRTPGRSRQW